MEHGDARGGGDGDAVEAGGVDRVAQPVLEADPVDDENVGAAADGSKLWALWLGWMSWVTAIPAVSPTTLRVKSATWVVVATTLSSALPPPPGVVGVQPARVSAAATSRAGTMKIFGCTLRR